MCCTGGRLEGGVYVEQEKVKCLMVDPGCLVEPGCFGLGFLLWDRHEGIINFWEIQIERNFNIFLLVLEIIPW